MDPLSIACGSVSLAATVTNLLTKITLFILDVKGARKDIDAVARELVSLKLCLIALEDEDQRKRLKLPDAIRRHIQDILKNCELIAHQMTEILQK